MFNDVKENSFNYIMLLGVFDMALCEFYESYIFSVKWNYINQKRSFSEGSVGEIK
jgi:hypothetical protein